MTGSGMNNLDSQEFWDEIKTTFHLSQDKLKELRITVQQIQEVINQHRYIEVNDGPRSSRKEITNQLKKLSSRLSKTISVIDDGDASTNHLFAPMFADWFTNHLTNQAFDRLLGRALPWAPPSIHDSDSYEAEGWTGAVSAMESRHRRQRRDFANRSGARLLTALLADIKAQVDRQLELRRHINLGSPGRIYRNYVVHQLALAYEPIFGKPPETGLRATFAEICEIVLTEMDESTDGLERSMDRILQKLNTV